VALSRRSAAAAWLNSRLHRAPGQHMRGPLRAGARTVVRSCGDQPALRPGPRTGPGPLSHGPLLGRRTRRPVAARPDLLGLPDVLTADGNALVEPRQGLDLRAWSRNPAISQQHPRGDHVVGTDSTRQARTYHGGARRTGRREPPSRRPLLTRRSTA